jgi:glycosyltransferase involved in cell wall biosynthesis
MQSNIKISIITATWNSRATLLDCLNSVEWQDYENIEHVLVDGVSTDGTLDVINSRMHQINKFICEPDGGIYEALNKGIKMASGEIIGFLHADDLYASNDVLSRIADAFLDPKIDAVYGDLLYVDKFDTSKVIRRWKSGAFKKSDLDWGWMPAHPTLYVRRQWYAEIGGFNVNYRIAADYLSILKLFRQEGFKSVYLPKIFVKMRIGGSSNRSIQAIIEKSREDWRVLRSCNFNVPDAIKAIASKNLSKIKQFI